MKRALAAMAAIAAAVAGALLFWREGVEPFLALLIGSLP